MDILTFKLQYEDLLWLGGSYRYSDLVAGYSATMGLNISNTFNISYSYEVATTNRLRNYTGTIPRDHALDLSSVINT